MSKKNGKKQLQASPASSWKKKTKFIELPSGLIVEVQDVDLKSLIMSGKSGNAPDILTADVMEMIQGYSDDESQQIEFDLSDSDIVIPFIERLIRAVLVDPKIVDSDPDYDNHEILFSDMDLEQEVIFIFEQLMSGVELAAAQRFRQGQDEVVVAVQPGQDVPAVAE